MRRKRNDEKFMNKSERRRINLRAEIVCFHNRVKENERSIKNE